MEAVAPTVPYQNTCSHNMRRKLCWSNLMEVHCGMQAEWHGSTVAVKMLKRSDSIAMHDFRTELDVLQKVLCKAAQLQCKRAPSAETIRDASTCCDILLHPVHQWQGSLV